VHEGVKAEVIEAAARFAASVYNQQLFPSILRLTFGDDSECPTVSFETESEEDLTAKATIINTLKTAGAGSIIGLDWLGKTFDIPKPGAGEKTLADVAVEADPNQPPGKGRTPTKDEATLARVLQIEDDAVFAKALQAFAGALTAHSYNESQHPRAKDGKWTDGDVEAAGEGMRRSKGSHHMEEGVKDSQGNGDYVDRLWGSQGGSIEWDSKEMTVEPDDFPRIRWSNNSGKEGTGRTTYLEALSEAKKRGHKGLQSDAVQNAGTEDESGPTPKALGTVASLVRRGFVNQQIEKDGARNLSITEAGERFLKLRSKGGKP